MKYAGPLNWGDLPVDSHELIAMCAPRPVFFSAGSTNGDAWVDAQGTFMAVAAAGPVYRLLGKADGDWPSGSIGMATCVLAEAKIASDKPEDSKMNAGNPAGGLYMDCGGRPSKKKIAFEWKTSCRFQAACVR